nr:hypothetical protein DVH24_019739 [Ipomoea batatas]GMD01978.1 hypothetical protein DVH24_019739 [Ipomoea batatas]
MKFSELFSNSMDIFVCPLSLFQLDMDIFLDLSHGVPQLISWLVQLIGPNGTITAKALLYQCGFFRKGKILNNVKSCFVISGQCIDIHVRQSHITIAASALRSNFTTSTLTPFTAICNAVCPFLSVLLASCGSFSSKALTISTCPCLAAKCNAFFPLDLAISTRVQSFTSNSLTTAVCPLDAAVIRGVAFEGPTVLLSSGSWSNSTCTMAALHSTSQPFENQYHQVFASPLQDHLFEPPSEAPYHCACPSLVSHISFSLLDQFVYQNLKALEQVLLPRMEMGLVMAQTKNFGWLLD